MWPAARLIIFLASTAALTYVSRRSLTKPRTHGFFRFFVFEAILGSCLLNIPVWFVRPMSWNQLISWLLLLASPVPLLFGIRDLRRHGEPDAAKRPEPELLGFERTSRVISSGIYRHIRHPLYTSLLLLQWGVFFKSPSIVGIVLAAVATGGVISMSLLEEAECLRAFGEEYRAYMLRTKRFVPHVI